MGARHIPSHDYDEAGKQEIKGERSPEASIKIT